MDSGQFNARVRDEMQEFVCSGRSERAVLLAWFLYNFFRLDKEEAIDAVCDQPNDKGIDGIYVDETSEEIWLFQSKFSPKNNQDQGDNDLRNFVGARQWFRNSEAVQALLDVKTVASMHLKGLVERSKLAEKLDAGYSINLLFVTNKIFDKNAQEYLDVNIGDLEGVDITGLFDKYTYVADKEIQTEEKVLRLENNSRIEYDLPNGVKVKLFAIQAKELLKLEGIQDKTLFSKNVRYGLGKTRVNKEIARTVADQAQHGNFFMYHNGITIVTGSLIDQGEREIILKNYSVINGCQSILTLYESRQKLSKDVFLPVKIVQLDTSSQLIQKITYFTNNQNAISLKDLKSDDRVQRAIQREFGELFNGRVFYRSKRGDVLSGCEETIESDFAAQLIEAFYLGNPQSTHLKNDLFGEKYSKIFSKNITADKIYLAKIIYDVIEENIVKITNEQIRAYGMAKFFFTYVFGEIIKADKLGLALVSNPKDFILKDMDVLKKTFLKLWGFLSADINAYIEDYTEKSGNIFDYKNVFKNADFIRSGIKQIKLDHQRNMIRHPEDSFENIYKNLSKID